MPATAAAFSFLTPVNVFIISIFVIAWSGPWLVSSLTKIARYLGWREFVVAFFLIAFAGSFPNLSVGITSALRGIPELSFGDVVGGNLIDLSLAVALAVIISGRAIPAEGVTLRSSIFFSISIALLPLLLIWDGTLSRVDGILLILSFLVYIFWLFSKSERFKQVYEQEEMAVKEEGMQEVKRFKDFLLDLGKVGIGVVLLLAGADGVVWSASFFAEALKVSLPVIGLLLVGLGNALPEVYFAAYSAKKGHTDMVLGDLMGSVIVPASLVLGLVVLIRPIEGVDLSPFAIGRLFLILASVVFLIVAKTGRKITKNEAFILFGIYILFVLLEIVNK